MKVEIIYSHTSKSLFRFIPMSEKIDMKRRGKRSYLDISIQKLWNIYQVYFHHCAHRKRKTCPARIFTSRNCLQLDRRGTKLDVEIDVRKPVFSISTVYRQFYGLLRFNVHSKMSACLMAAIGPFRSFRDFTEFLRLCS